MESEKYEGLYGQDEEEKEIEFLKKEIEKYKKKHEASIEDTAKLGKKREEADNLTKKLKERIEKEGNKLMESEDLLRERNQEFQEDINSRWNHNQQLKAKKQGMEETVDYLGKEREKLETVCSSGMERKMVFKGKLSEKISRCGINVKHQIKYTVRGGTALIVFEEPSVAARLIKKRLHRVVVEECYINVRAEPVELTVLDSLNVDMDRSPWKILVSNLPADVPQDKLLDKIELFFSKPSNGGGEVEFREYLADSRSVTLTFTQEGVAPRLVEKRTFNVPFSDRETHQVCVSPSLDGTITGYQMKRLQCNRTVLITGIPDIKDEDTMNDLLEIHFQKESNEGGEVQKLFYCPEGKNAVVVFEDDEDE
ncbi:interferon-induced 35 kDa protein [Dendropsophus ebraccatus]|uniref:interferon-induced 35 kDa protein n=1 Tax=Dendropsophus ebraccatus TaxID=150705 RepID=UPI003831C6D5